MISDLLPYDIDEERLEIIFSYSWPKSVTQKIQEKHIKESTNLSIEDKFKSLKEMVDNSLVLFPEHEEELVEAFQTIKPLKDVTLIILNETEDLMSLKVVEGEVVSGFIFRYRGSIYVITDVQDFVVAQRVIQRFEPSQEVLTESAGILDYLSEYPENFIEHIDKLIKNKDLEKDSLKTLRRYNEMINHEHFKETFGVLYGLDENVLEAARQLIIMETEVNSLEAYVKELDNLTGMERFRSLNEAQMNELLESGYSKWDIRQICDIDSKASSFEDLATSFGYGMTLHKLYIEGEIKVGDVFSEPDVTIELLEFKEDVVVVNVISKIIEATEVEVHGVEYELKKVDGIFELKVKGVEE